MLCQGAWTLPYSFMGTTDEILVEKVQDLHFRSSVEYTGNSLDNSSIFSSIKEYNCLWIDLCQTENRET